MSEEVTWIEDIVKKESKLLSTLTLTGNSNFKLVGNCDVTNLGSINHEYKEGAQQSVDKKMMDAVKYLKDQYAENEYDIMFIKSLTESLDDNLVSRQLKKLGASGEQWIKDIIGSSSNISAIRSAAATLKFWRNTNVDLTIPTFVTYLTPKVNGGSVTSTLSQLNSLIDKLGGTTTIDDRGGYTTDAAGVLGPKTTEIARSLFGKDVNLVAPWYEYKSPNNYMPEEKSFETLYNIKNSFILQVNGMYKYIDLLIKKVGIEASKQLIELDNGITFPYWIKLTCDFTPAYEVAQIYLKHVLRLIQSLGKNSDRSKESENRAQSNRGLKR